MSTSPTDEGKFDELYRRYYRLILTTAERRVESLAIAEDVTSEVFRIAWQHHHRGGGLTLSWLYTTVHHVVGNEYRRARRAAELVQRVGDITPPQAPTPDLDLVLDVAQAMRRLKAQDREVLQLAYWDDLGGDELSQVLGISPVAARSRLMRARKALKSLLTAPALIGRSAPLTEVGEHG